MDELRQPDDGTGHADGRLVRGRSAETSAGSSAGQRGGSEGDGLGGEAWRVNGAHSAAVGHENGDQRWSNAGSALEPAAEPLALLAGGRVGEARHRQQQYAPGLDDDTPVSGLPVTEPGGEWADPTPLWREASRHSASPNLPYGSQPVDYGTAPTNDLAEAQTEEPTLLATGRAEPVAPDRAEPVGPYRAEPVGPYRGEPGTSHQVEPTASRRAEPATPHLGYDSPPPPPAPPPPPGQVSPPPGQVPPPPGQVPPPPGQSEPPAGYEPPTEPAGLPQRVPAEPDVPVSEEEETTRNLAEAGSDRDRWTAPELAWIAERLRDVDVPGEAPPETLDVDAVVAAVREVDGVQEAAVHPNPTGVHTLKLDLADDADPGQVSRAVARLLLERMGLSAAPQHVPQTRSGQESTVPPPPPDWQPTTSTPPLTPSNRRAAPAPAPTTSPAPAPTTPPAPPPEPLGDAPSPVRELQDGWNYEPPHSWDYDPPLAREQLAAGGDDGPAEEIPEPVFRPLPASETAPRVVIEQVQVRTFGLEATVEVELTAGDRRATGVAAGPAVDSYLVRLAAVAGAQAIDELLRGVVMERAGEVGGGPSRCFIEHTGVVPFGNTEVAVVVLLLVCGGWVEQLTGSALVDGDPRQAMVRATLGAVNRRLSALLD